MPRNYGFSLEPPETPPWDVNKRIAREQGQYGEVFWQSTQNPQSFLDSVMHGVGELSE